MILILGVTASGKSRLAFDLACDLSAEIICIDSMKVYRRMDIGTAKPPAKARERIKYHLIDVAEPSETFSVGRFMKLANQAVERIKAENKPVIAVGGTALYIKALLYGLFDGPAGDEKIREKLKHLAETEGLDSLHKRLAQIDPQAAERIHPNDKKRIVRALEVHEITGRPISSFQNQWNAAQDTTVSGPMRPWTIIGLRREKTAESSRINQRVKKMIEAGLVDEVKSLLAEPNPLSKQARCAIGYAEIIEHLQGKISLDDAVELIKKNTRKLAKHQRTWFKTFKNIHWLDIEDQRQPEEILTQIKDLSATA